MVQVTVQVVQVVKMTKIDKLTRHLAPPPPILSPSEMTKST